MISKDSLFAEGETAHVKLCLISLFVTEYVFSL